ncbi:hypothetical protein [Acinetobacter johnsonii]|uniref:hypothetical protein n=1 Tax=Acinetobacter johnsonii TaxID=40214 RepID=UPI0011E89A10|nr:hypothetical protein [Acinetobacter johnsonii]QEK37194.1 hypothetical protein FYN22_15835 [Acinetobacter johnsonii]
MISKNLSKYSIFIGLYKYYIFMIFLLFLFYFLKSFVLDFPVVAKVVLISYSLLTLSLIVFDYFINGYSKALVLEFKNKKSVKNPLMNFFFILICYFILFYKYFFSDLTSFDGNYEGDLYFFKKLTLIFILYASLVFFTMTITLILEVMKNVRINKSN